MPTYEYSCQKCGHDFEWTQSMSSTALSSCPEDVCPGRKWGKGKVQRRIGGGAGLIFKGSGFYITDYRSEGYKSAAKKDSAPSTDSKTESKPSVAGESKSPAKLESKAESKVESKGDSKPATHAAKPSKSSK